MTLVLATGIAAGVLTIIFRSNRTVRHIAAIGALLFTLLAIFLDWQAVTQLPLTFAAAIFLALVVIALLLPRGRAKKSPTIDYWEQEPAGESTPETSKPSVPALYHADTLLAVSEGLRASFERRGLSRAEADELFNRLTANLRVLEQLHALVVQMAAGDAAAWTEFRTRLQYLTRRFPKYAGSRNILRERVGSAPPNLNARGPCAIVSLPGMASLYTGVIAAGALGEMDVPLALDVLTGLSLGHGHLEVTSGGLIHDGAEGLDRLIEEGASKGNPYFIRPDGNGRGDGFTDPLPDGTTGDGGMPFTGFIPGEFVPPSMDACELVRETCEAMLLDALTEGAGDGASLSSPNPPTCQVENIERLELSGECAGSVLSIIGHGFGDRPNGRVVVLNVRGECVRVAVPPSPLTRVRDFDIPMEVMAGFVPYWSDTRINLVLPNEITPGTVGIFDPNSIELYNNWSSQTGRRAQEVVVSSKCMETPVNNGAPGSTQVEIRVPLPSSYTPCPANTGRNVIEKVGRPIILGFAASTGQEQGTAIMADPDEELTLQWNVINATGITLTRLSAEGPLFGSQRDIANPPGNSWSFVGRLGHTNFATYIYELTAINGNHCGQVTARVKVYASKRPRLGINRIEVTQGIQNSSNTVPLVEGKPTVVRVFVNHGLNHFANLTGVEKVKGRMRVLGADGTPLLDWQDPINTANSTTSPATPNSAAFITVPTILNRAMVNDTLNFRIPDEFCTGTIGIEVEAFVENFSPPRAGGPGFTEHVFARFDGFEFKRRRRLKIRFIPVKLDADPNGVLTISSAFSNPPTDAQCSNLILKSMKFIPTQADVSRLEGWSAEISITTVKIYTPWGSFVLERPLPVASSSPVYDILANLFLEWAGANHNQDDGEIWAILIPSTQLWGRARGKEFLVRMTPDAAAHELSHCLGQEHISVLCPNGSQASGGDTPHDWREDGGEVKDVPFDIGINNTVTDPVGVWELMTYCGTRWTSPKRWKMLFESIGE
jgi:hypothetical protein